MNRALISLLTALGALASPAAAAPRQDANLLEVERAVERIELLWTIDRDLAKARSELERLAEEAEAALRTDPTDAAAREAFTTVLLQTLDLLFETGGGGDVIARVAELSGATGKKDATPIALAFREIAADPRVAEAVSRASANSGQDAPAAASADRVEEAVRRALETGRMDFIDQLGELAVPALEKIVVEDLEFVIVSASQGEAINALGHRDALTALIAISPGRAGKLIVNRLDDPGLLWKRRIVSALGTRGALAAIWDNSTFPAKCIHPEYLTIVERLVDDPQVGTEVLGLLGPVVDAGGPTPRLMASLRAALDGDDPERTNAALRAFSGSYWYRETNRAFLEAALANERAYVRGNAARKLAAFPWNDALAARVDDPETRVRYEIVRMTTPRTVGIWNGNEWVERDHVPELEKRRAVLTRLADDPDPGVRRSALDASFSLPRREVRLDTSDGSFLGIVEYVDPLPDAVYLKLARDPDAEVRKRLASGAKDLPPGLRTEVLAEMAATEQDRKVLGYVDGGLSTFEASAQPELVFEIIEARYRNPHRPFDPNTAVRVWAAVRNHRAALNRFVEWACDQEDAAILTQIVFQSNRVQIEAAQLSPEVLVTLFESMDLVGETVIRTLSSHDMSSDHRQALLRLAQDPSQPVHVRLFSAGAGAREGGEPFVRAMTAVLSDRHWSTIDDSEFRQRRHHWLGKYVHDTLNLAKADANAVILAIVEDRSVDDRLAGFAAEVFRPGDPGGPEIAREILARWNGRTNEDTWGAVASVIVAMGTVPEIVDPEVIEAAVRGSHYHRAFDTIAALRDPRYLAVIEEVIRTDPPATSQRWHKAVEALPGFLSNEAAELLLVAASLAKKDEKRKWCLDKLEEIRTFQEAKERWATRSSNVQTREEVVAELIALLEDSDDSVRVQAIRGLATWEAVEAMPRLIRLIRDDSSGVAAEAEKALDRLNSLSTEDGK